MARITGSIAMTMLWLAALLWLVLHLGLAGSRLRDMVAARIGEAAFRLLFSLLSLAAIVFLVRAWSLSLTEPLWIAPNWLRWLLVLAMLPATLLFVASLSQPNPTMVGPPQLMAQPARGITRITRHPMLWSFAIWAAVHVAGNGDSASVLFFGAFLVTALAGMPSIDAKLAGRDPATWQALAAATSILPFGAILAGRNRLVVRELGWIAPLIGVVAWAALLVLHPLLFGVAPVVW
jgi:uncharacterized membrane protein